MTTAHRPTWAPAKGGTNDEQSGSRVFAPSTFFRAKDQVAHTKLKFRQELLRTLPIICLTSSRIASHACSVGNQGRMQPKT